MRKEDALVFSFSLAMLVFCVVYHLAFAVPAYYPLEHLWRWEKIAGLPAMSWYARFGWSLLACAGSAIAIHLALPSLLSRWSTARLHRVSMLAWAAAIVVYLVVTFAMVRHEVQALL